MSARRWSVLLGFVLVSLVLSVGWVAWALWFASPGNRMGAIGITGILQLIEIPLAYFLLRLNDYAYTWTLRFNLVKLVTAVALATGAFAGGIRDPLLIALALVVSGFYGGYTLFLRANAEFFD
jgi:hypothetical protein